MYWISSSENHSVEILNNIFIKIIIIIGGNIYTVVTITQQFFTSENFKGIELNPSYFLLSTYVWIEFKNKTLRTC
jgi:hypothetical protein